METSAAITQRSGSNLALAFILLPKERRRDMAALYAFCREVDDVADEDTCPVEERGRRLEEWRQDVRAACEGGEPRFPVNRELREVIRTRKRRRCELRRTIQDRRKAVESLLVVRRGCVTEPTMEDAPKITRELQRPARALKRYADD